MNFQVTQNKDGLVLALDGSLTILDASDLKRAFAKAFKLSKRVILKLEGVTDADLSCLQILWSAMKTTQEKGKILSLAGKIPDCLSQIAEDAGYPDLEMVLSENQRITGEMQ